MQLTAVGLDNVTILVQIADQSIVIGAGLLCGGRNNILQMCQHIIHVLHGSGFDIVGLNSGIVQNLLGLLTGHGNDLVGLGVSLLHDLMLVDQLIGMHGSLVDQCFCLGFGIV